MRSAHGRRRNQREIDARNDDILMNALHGQDEDDPFNDQYFDDYSFDGHDFEDFSGTRATP